MWWVHESFYPLHYAKFNFTCYVSPPPIATPWSRLVLQAWGIAWSNLFSRGRGQDKWKISSIVLAVKYATSQLTQWCWATLRIPNTGLAVYGLKKGAKHQQWIGQCHGIMMPSLKIVWVRAGFSFLAGNQQFLVGVSFSAGKLKSYVHIDPCRFLPLIFGHGWHLIRNICRGQLWILVAKLNSATGQYSPTFFPFLGYWVCN